MKAGSRRLSKAARGRRPKLQLNQGLSLPSRTTSANFSVHIYSFFPVLHQERILLTVHPRTEFQRSISGPAPIYTDYQVDTRFACLLEIEGEPSPFGSLTSLHGSKKAARHDAARCAVDHFKAQGTWPDTFTDVGGIRKKKSAPAATTTTTTTPQQIKLPARIPPSSGPAPSTPPSAPAKPPSPAVSYTSQVAELAAALSLPAPEYIDTPCADAPDFHTVECVFRNAEPHAGPHGEVRNIFGRKKAREECARLTLAVLEEVRREREALAERVLAELAGEGPGLGANEE
jgi:hypothetical protein